MKINTHGLKIKGLKKASGATENYGPYSASYVEIFYDRSTGETWTKYQHSLGHNWWTQYDDPDVIKICSTSEHMTMQRIADLIEEKVLEDEQDRAEYAEFIAAGRENCWF